MAKLTVLAYGRYAICAILITWHDFFIYCISKLKKKHYYIDKYTLYRANICSFIIKIKNVPTCAYYPVVSVQNTYNFFCERPKHSIWQTTAFKNCLKIKFLSLSYTKMCGTVIFFIVILYVLQGLSNNSKNNKIWLGSIFSYCQQNVIFEPLKPLNCHTFLLFSIFIHKKAYNNSSENEVYVKCVETINYKVIWYNKESTYFVFSIR